MAWTIGTFSEAAGGVYLHRTPRVEGKVPHSLEACSRDEFAALVDLFEAMGREPLTAPCIREILGPRALMGESE